MARFSLLATFALYVNFSSNFYFLALAFRRNPNPPPLQLDGVANIYECGRREGVSATCCKALASSVSSSTLSCYQRHWREFCKYVKAERSQSALSVSVISDFLLFRFHTSSSSCSSLNIARSAISFFTLNKFNLGEDPIICRLFKYFYNARPQLKRYLTYWPVAKVLNFLSKWHPASSLSLKQLTLKTIALIALSSSDRGQTLDLLDINNVEITDSGISFIVTKKLKHHRKSINPKSVNCVQSDIDSLNVSSYVTSYMEKTSALRQNENGKLSPAKLFLSWATKKEVSKQTISRWLTTVLALSGIDIQRSRTFGSIR